MPTDAPIPDRLRRINPSDERTFRSRDKGTLCCAAKSASTRLFRESRRELCVIREDDRALFQLHEASLAEVADRDVRVLAGDARHRGEIFVSELQVDQHAVW